MTKRLRGRRCVLIGTLGLFGLLQAAPVSARTTGGSEAFSGTTSQSLAFKVTVDSLRRVGLTIAYSETCTNPDGSTAGSSTGTFTFTSSAGVALDANGRFSHSTTFSRTLTNGQQQYFNSTDQVTGRVASTRASGTFSFTGQFYSAATNAPLGTCITGTVNWSAPLAGGSGTVSTNGTVGPLRLDRSSAADVIAFAGPPDAQGTGDVVSGYPRYEALGYSCSSQPADGNSFTSEHGPYCHTVYYINQRTQELAAFFTSSERFTGPGGVYPSMPAASARSRIHQPAISGCRTGFFIKDLIVEVFGGHNRLTSVNGHPTEVLIGGTVGDFDLESAHHPVGLEFC